MAHAHPRPDSCGERNARVHGRTAAGISAGRRDGERQAAMVHVNDQLHFGAFGAALRRSSSGRKPKSRGTASWRARYRQLADLTSGPLIRSFPLKGYQPTLSLPHLARGPRRRGPHRQGRNSQGLSIGLHPGPGGQGCTLGEGPFIPASRDPRAVRAGARPAPRVAAWLPTCRVPSMSFLPQTEPEKASRSVKTWPK